MNSYWVSLHVIPAKAGIQIKIRLDPRLREDDKVAEVLKQK